METEETFASALKRHIFERGYSITNTRHQVRIASALRISVPFLQRLVNGNAEVTEELTAKLATFFETDAKYWSGLRLQSAPQKAPQKSVTPHPQESGPRQVIEGVSYKHELPENVREATTWPHAEYAAELARQPDSGCLIKIEPKLFMGGVTVKEDDLIRVLDVYYVERLEAGGFTLWAGKRATYQRPYKNSVKWSLQSVEPLERMSHESLSYSLLEKILSSWARHEWNGKTDDFPYGQRRTLAPPAKALVGVDALSLATTAELEDLLRACSRILRIRQQDDSLFEYEVKVDTGASPDTPKRVVLEMDGNGNTAERPIKFKDLGKIVHGKVRQRVEHFWKATYQAKNGSVVKGDDWMDSSILISGHRIDLYTMDGADDEQQAQERIERFVRGIRDEFLEQAKKNLLDREKHLYLESSYPQYKDERLALAAYVEWATRGTNPFTVEQLFHYPIDHYYREDGNLPDVFLVTVENNSVAMKNIPFPPQPVTRGRRNVEMRYSTGRVSVPAKNGDGIKVCEGAEVRYYFPFKGALQSFREDAITEARFHRYVNGYRREILPEVEKLRQNTIEKLAERQGDDQEARIKVEIENLDRFIEWLSQRPTNA